VRYMTNKKFKNLYNDGTYLTDFGKYALKKFFHMDNEPTKEQCDVAAKFLGYMLDVGELINE